MTGTEGDAIWVGGSPTQVDPAVVEIRRIIQAAVGVLPDCPHYNCHDEQKSLMEDIARERRAGQEGK